MQYFGFDRPSFALKTFGFGESSPKLQADFTTGTYKADGATKTFTDLFTFTRAGKAWLVKDTGLQEYAADVPRFDNGLLIEQSATNYNLYSGLQDGARYSRDVTPISTIFGSGGLVTKEKASYLYQPRYSKSPDVKSISFYLLESGGRVPIPESEIRLMPLTMVNNLKTDKINTITRVSYTSDSPDYAYVGITNTYAFNPVPYPYIISGFQQTDDSFASSYIPTTATTVTRPADFLFNKITGTTVTGDWDSTLTLSIVDGQLVHSGYGRIRSLEIN